MSIKSVEDKSIGMTDEEKIALYCIEHALASETVSLGYLVDESDLEPGALREALSGLIRRKLIIKTKKEYELRNF